MCGSCRKAAITAMAAAIALSRSRLITSQEPELPRRSGRQLYLVQPGPCFSGRRPERSAERAWRERKHLRALSYKSGIHKVLKHFLDRDDLTKVIAKMKAPELNPFRGTR